MKSRVISFFLITAFSLCTLTAVCGPFAFAQTSDALGSFSEEDDLPAYGHISTEFFNPFVEESALSVGNGVPSPASDFIPDETENRVNDWDDDWENRTDFEYDDVYDPDDFEEEAGFIPGGNHFNDWRERDADDLASFETGIGSCLELDGNIVVVSIFANDRNTSWDFTDPTNDLLREHSLAYLKIAASWIEENGALWGYYPVFFYDWEKYPDLYYETSMDYDITDPALDPTNDMSEFIENNIDPDSLLEEYDAESILFVAFYKTPRSNMVTSFTYPYTDTSDYPYEICHILTGCEGREENPATYAHEILHTFGAPDLYTAKDPEYNYNISQRFVDYCDINYPNEIMRTTFDVDTMESYYDHISNELSGITAYYIGWTDTCSEQERFQLQESQHLQQ